MCSPRQIGLLKDHYVTLGAAELVERRQGRHMDRAPMYRQGALSAPARGAPWSPVSWANHEEDLQWQSTNTTKTTCPFSSMSKRRRGYPSESRVKRGDRVVHGNKELIREAWTQRSMSMRFRSAFQDCCLASGSARRFAPQLLQARPIVRFPCARDGRLAGKGHSDRIVRETRDAEGMVRSGGLSVMPGSVGQFGSTGYQK